MRYVCWFSCGAASAVAAKLSVDKYNAEVMYCDTMATEHPDNQRFFDDVQAWIGKPITKIKSDKYATVDEVFEKTKYMAGIKGARCTVEMKKIPREVYQRPDDIHIFGYTYDEQGRMARFEEQNPSLQVEWILADIQITKNDCYNLLNDALIKLPEMYRLGYDHNNCLGCVKASSPYYWQKIRIDFPEVFQRRAEQSRSLGVRLTRYQGERIFLDELPDVLLPKEREDIECGPVCQIPLEFE